MTDEDLDRFRRFQDSGQHGEQEEPRRLPDLRVLAVAVFFSAILMSLVLYGLVVFVSAAWRWS